MSRINVQQKVGNKISSRKRKFSTINIIVIAVIAIFILGGIAIYAMVDSGKKVDSNSFNQVVTPDNVKEVLAEMATTDKTEIGAYEVNMNTTWTFKDSSTPSSDATVGNSTSNQNTVYFTIALTKDNTQVYKSPYIPVGSNLKNIVLDEKLAAGTYPAVITYYLVDSQYIVQSHVAVNMTLTVQN